MLSYLDEVARAGSIRRASARLGIAASSINRQIIALEELYGVQLFERLPRRLRLTTAGELLIGHVRQTLRNEAMLRSQFVELQGSRSGTVRIASIGGIIPVVMPALLAWMRSNSPFVKLVVRAMPLDALVGAVVGGEADLGLGYQIPPDPKLQVLARVPSRLGAIMAPDHPLAKLNQISLSDCVGFPMVLPDASLTIGVLLRDALLRASISVERLTETNSIELLRAAGAMPDTIAFLSEIETVSTTSERVVFVPFRGTSALTQELRLVARRTAGLDATQSRIAEELRGLLSRIVSS